MGDYLGATGLALLWNKIKSYITSKHFAGSIADGGPANKAVSIPFGQVDSTSTSTAFTATVDGITELRDGVCVYLRNGVVTSASGYTININNLGAKPVYTSMSNASASTIQYQVNYTMLFVYNSTRVDGGCWDLFYGYYSDTNTIGYNISDYAIRKPVKNVLYSYRFLCTRMDGLLLPVNTDNGTTAATHVLTKESFNPWGQVYYYNSTTTVNAGALPASGTLYSQATYGVYPYLRYSFNTGNTLVANNDIYIKCIPQPDGSAILADDAIVFALPTYEDGFIYKRLGKAYDTYRIILEQDKPVYYYKDGIKLWTGYNLQEGVMVTDEFTKKDSGVTSDVRVKSVGGKTVVWNQLVADVNAVANVYGITRTKVNDYTLHYSGISESSTSYTGTSNFSVIAGHKYYFSAKGVPSTCRISRATGIAYGQSSFIYTAASSDIWNFGVYIASGTSIDNDITFFAVDLTQMLGAGNEPSTVEEFEAMFPEDSYAYDAGRIVNVAMTGMKSLDADGSDLDAAELDVTTLTGVADGGSTSEIIFPNGMNGIGDVRDEIDLVNGRAVKRIGVVDMGTLSWSQQRNQQLELLHVFAATVEDKIELNGEGKSVLACQNYCTIDRIGWGPANAKDKVIFEPATSALAQRVGISDSAYSDAATFTTAMSGVILYYELATPIEYTLDTTPSCVMSVAKGGKEMILPYNASEPQCAPVRIVEEYGTNVIEELDGLEGRISNIGTAMVGVEERVNTIDITLEGVEGAVAAMKGTFYEQ